MDMSIARFAALSRHHERQPRLGKLQLRGVDRGVDHARLHGRREPVRAKAVANRLQRAALNARRRDRTWKFLAWSVVAGVLASLLIGVVVFAAALLVIGGWWWLALALVALFVTPLAEPIVMRHVLVPLGWYRAAFWVGHVVSMEDSDAGALVARSSTARISS